MNMEKTYRTRQRKLVELLPREFEAVFLTNLSNIRYLCGYSGSCGYLLLNRVKTVFFTDFRYQEQADLEVGKAAEISVFKTNGIDAATETLKSWAPANLGIEGSLSVDQYQALQKKYSGELKTVPPLTEKLRRQKDAHELKSLRKAFQIGDRAFARLVKFLKPGRKETDVAAKLEYEMKKLGSEMPSFGTIIASGHRSSCPHAHPTIKKLGAGEMVKIDFGAVYNGYHSDMTRTVFLGPADKRFRDVYATVLEAQTRAVKALKIGARCVEIDAIARDYIASKGFGENFGHGLGHALGLDIHEGPGLSYKTSPEELVTEGMVYTVEPGIYLPGWGGIRIEDVYLVKSDGLEKLTQTPNDLLEIV
jgi:Xaa-Pro aminopeptidase